MPNVERAALAIEGFGAHGITVHPRPDGRHILFEDVVRLKELLEVELNVEGNPTEEFVALIEQVRPAQVTLVPDAEDALTSSAGWDTVRYAEKLAQLCSHFRALGVRCSIFVDPSAEMVRGAAACGADRVELYTEEYARQFAEATTEEQRRAAIAPYVEAAEAAAQCGLGLNAGHDLNLENLNFYLSEIPHTDEVSIGHALICDALEYGMESTVKRYLAELPR